MVTFIPIVVTVVDPHAKLEATTTVVMHHDEAVKFFLHNAIPGICSPPMTLRKVGATLAAMEG